MPVQYLIWLKNIVHGDFGRSYSLNRPVLDEVFERFGATLVLAATAFVLCTIWGIAAGVVSAVRQYSWADRIVTILVLTEFYGLGLEEASSVALVLWAINFVVIIPVGLALAFHEGIKWRSLKHIESGTET